MASPASPEPRGALVLPRARAVVARNGGGVRRAAARRLERFDSPWAISLVLLADLLPAMLLGPFFGAVADRWSRRTCMVVGGPDPRRGLHRRCARRLLRRHARPCRARGDVGTAPVHAGRAGGPAEPGRGRAVPAATSLYGAIADLGFTAGPALAAGVAARRPRGRSCWSTARPSPSRPCSWRCSRSARSAERRDARRGQRPVPDQGGARGAARSSRGMRGIRVVILVASAVALFFGGPLQRCRAAVRIRGARDGDAGYAVLVAAFGLGFIGGSLAGSKGGTHERLRGRFLSGIALIGLGLLLSGIAPSVALAARRRSRWRASATGCCSCTSGCWCRSSVPDGAAGARLRRQGRARVLGVRPGVLLAGALLTLTSPRELIVAAGVGALLVWAATAAAAAPAGRAGCRPGGAEGLGLRRPRPRPARPSSSPRGRARGRPARPAGAPSRPPRQRP